MKTKHTPGPWLLSAEQNVFGYCGEQLIAKTVSIVAGEDLANAQLIAAAPDLLETLETADAFFKAHKKLTGIDYDCAREIEAAIRKAKGEL